MDFKKLIKNKYVIIGASILLVAIIFVSLISVKFVFYKLSCFAFSVFCAYIGVCVIIKINKIKTDRTAELLPLTEEDNQYIEKFKRRKIFNYALIATMFICSAIVFLSFGIKI